MPTEPAPYTLRSALTRWFTPRLRRQLGQALAAALLLPWLIGTWAKQFVQPGLHDSAERASALIDYMVLGGMLFSLSMVLTWLIGMWVLAVMQGPRLDGDAFPAEPDARP